MQRHILIIALALALPSALPSALGSFTPHVKSSGALAALSAPAKAAVTGAFRWRCHGLLQVAPPRWIEGWQLFQLFDAPASQLRQQVWGELKRLTPAGGPPQRPPSHPLPPGRRHPVPARPPHRSQGERGQ
jgi:hypothetical protein